MVLSKPLELGTLELMTIFMILVLLNVFLRMLSTKRLLGQTQSSFVYMTII